jgi:aryl-alcohol dehydrogenase-like predicted oxidoreductase
MLLEEHRATREESRLIFDRFAGSGGALIDITDGYQKGQSEEFLGELLANDRDYFVVATKHTQGADGSKTGDGRKRTWFAR